MIIFNELEEQAPRSIDKFLKQEEINFLIDFFKSKKNDCFEKDGMLRLHNPWQFEEVRELLESRIVQELGEDIHNIGDNFFLTRNPYVIHTDGKTDMPGLRPYKNVVIPLKVDKDKFTKLITFKQRYHGKSAHFVKGVKYDFKPIYNEVINRCYSDIEELKYKEVESSIIEEWYNKNINIGYMPRQSFEHLSIDKEFEWTPGSAIIFDSWQLHCGHNFHLNNADWKLGLSLVFARPQS